MRIGKCPCGGEFIATAIQMDNITEITCKKCGQIGRLDEPIIPKRKRELINDFNRAINGGKQ